MQLATPLALWWLLAALTPIVIYWLLRRRKSVVQWGASYLLRRTLTSRRKSSIWKQYLVLALRAGVLALAALLLAGLLSKSSDQSISSDLQLPDQPVHRVVLLDDSSSMSVISGNQSRLNAAKEVMGRLLRQQRPGDATTLISLVDPTQTPQLLMGSMDPTQISTLLDSLATREGSVQLSSALARAASQLAQSPQSAAQVFILSDFPLDLTHNLERLSWLPAMVKQRQVQLAAVNMAPATDRTVSNIVLEQATLGADLLVAGVPTLIYADLANCSDVQAVARVRVSLDGKPLRELAVALQADQRKLTPIDVTLPEAGQHTLTLQVEPSRLASAARIDISVQVEKQLTVWGLADAPDPTQQHALGELDFLQRALESAGAETAAIKLEPIELNQLLEPVPAEVDVIVLAGPRVITPAVGQVLTQFVRLGGGLVISMAPGTDVDFYNENLTDLLPAALIKPSRETVDPEQFASARIESLAPEAQLLAEFGREGSGDLGAVRFYNHMLVAPFPEGKADDARVVLELSSREPLLLQRKFGRGNVYLLTSSLGISWSSLAVRPSFLPLIYRLTHAAAAGRALPRNVKPGKSVVLPWPGLGPAKLMHPDHDTSEIRPVRGADASFVVLQADQRGLYELTDDLGQRQTFTIVQPPTEGDLRSVTGQPLLQFERALGSPVYADWSAAVAALGPAESSTPLWQWLLLGMLVLYAIETALVRTL